MFETLSAVWTELATFITSALTPAVTFITSNALLVAPSAIGLGAMLIGKAKSTIRIGGKRK